MEITLSVIIWNIINLGLILWIVWRFASRPVSRMIDTKRRHMVDTLNYLEKSIKEINEQLTSQEQQMQNAAAEIESIEKNYHDMSATFIVNIDESAKDEAQKMKDQAKIMIAHELNQIRSELRKELAIKAVNTTKDMLKNYLDEPKQLKIVNDFASNLDKKSA